jgi:DnaK suppressor protein
MLVNSTVVTSKQAGAGVAAPKGADATGRSAEEIEQIRTVLRGRFQDLNSEYEVAVAENQALRMAEIGDAAGDDQADSGSKTAERDAASSLLRTLLDRRTQAEHAMARLEDGTYGYCDGCSNPIPVERLTAFPSATTCVRCKSVRERRAS